MKEQRFERVIKVKSYLNLWASLICQVGILIMLISLAISNQRLSNEQLISGGFALGLCFYGWMINFLLHFSKENRKVYWRKIK